MPSELNDPQTKKSRRLLWISLALVFVAGAAFLFIRQRVRANEIHFDTAPIHRGRIAARVTATGTLMARVTVLVGTQVSGRISALYADFNSQVKKGQVIAKIDPQFFEAAVEQARANLAEAQGNFAKAQAQAVDAQRQYQRVQSLKARDLVSQAEMDTAATNLEATKAQVEVAKGAIAQTKASLNQAKINLAYSTIYSPIDGVVISRNVDVGQTVAASLQAPTVFTIAQDLRKMQVHTNVAEADIGKLEKRMIASFTVDAFPGEQFRGTIYDVRNAAQTVQNVVTYDAVIDVDNPELKLRPGMTANVTVVWAQREDVLTVPNAALRFNPPAESIPTAQLARAAESPRPRGERGDRGPGNWQGPRQRGPQGREAGPPLNERIVWVLSGRTPEAKTIRIGVSDGTVTEAASGPIEEGDLVITGMFGGGVKTAQSQPPPGGFRGPRMF